MDASNINSSPNTQIAYDGFVQKIHSSHAATSLDLLIPSVRAEVYFRVNSRGKKK